MRFHVLLGSALLLLGCTFLVVYNGWVKDLASRINNQKDPEPGVLELSSLRTAVEAGHQPWRMEPLSVARSELRKGLAQRSNLPQGALSELKESDYHWTLRDSGSNITATFDTEGIHAEIGLKCLLSGDTRIWYGTWTRITWGCSPDSGSREASRPAVLDDIEFIRHFEIEREEGAKIVPEGTIWAVLCEAPPHGIHASDIFVREGLVSIDNLLISSKMFTLTFQESDSEPKIWMYPGSAFFLGDTRDSVVIEEYKYR